MVVRQRRPRIPLLPRIYDCLGKGGYASEVLQDRSDLSQVEQIWVMMFPEDKTNELPGWGAEEQHDPEKG
jgi:hypothetical protein